MTGLLTSAGRRHLLRMTQALLPLAPRLNRRFRAILRQAGYGPEPVEALLALTPAAAGACRSLARFLEQVQHYGRRLAKCDVTLSAVAGAQRQFDSLLEPLLAGRFAPAREQFSLMVKLVLQDAFYRVREDESQAFFDLAQAEAEASGIEDLLERYGRAMVRAVHATAGRVWQPPEAAPEFVRPHCFDRGEADWIAARLPPRCVSFWCHPFGPSAVLVLGFAATSRWLPRERALLQAAAARCREAVDRARMAEEIRRLEAESRHAEEEERRRIGRELHDEAGQSMALLRLQLEMIRHAAPPQLQPPLTEAGELAARTAVELRRIVAALSPSVLDRLGLERALRQLAVRVRQLHPAQFRLYLRPLPARCRRVDEVIYRVAQECLQNIVKHSRASHVNIRLDTADKLIRLRVTDNGAGFRADHAWSKPKSFGLAGMRERAGLLGGTLVVRSAPGKGTGVTLKLPADAAPVSSYGKDSRTVN